MQYGDLSNKVASTIVLDVEDLLLLPPKKGGKISRAMSHMSPLLSLMALGAYRCNPMAQHYIQDIFRTMDVMFYGVSFYPDHTLSVVYDKIGHLPLTNIFSIKDPDEIEEILSWDHVKYYYFINPEHYCWKWAGKCRKIKGWEEFQIG